MDQPLMQENQVKEQRMRELKQIEKRTQGTFSQNQRQLLESQYMTSMKMGYRDMRVMGISHTDFGKMEQVPSDGMLAYYKERQEASRIRQVELSSKKRKEKDRETDARKRQTYNSQHAMKQQTISTNSLVLELYQQRKEGDYELKEREDTKFAFSPEVHATDKNNQIQADLIADVMLKRDALRNRLNQANPSSDLEKAEQKYDEKLLQSMDDVVKTWLAAGGTAENNERISERNKEKALTHLPLAIENYEYYSQKREMVIGGYLIEQMKTTKEYKDNYQRIRANTIESGRSSIGIDKPIAGIYKDDIAALRELISEGGDVVEQKKELIKKVYEEYMQHNVAFNNINLEYNAAYTLARDLKTANYLGEWWDKHDFEVRQHEMAMDAAMAYLKFMIRGTVPDPTLAVYIEQHWGASEMTQHLEQNTNTYADRTAFRPKVAIMREQVRNHPEMTEKEKSAAYAVLDNLEEKSLNQQAEDLNRLTTVEYQLRNYNRGKFQVTGADPAGGGYRDVARVMLLLHAETVELNEEEVKKNKQLLYEIDRGKFMVDQTDEEGAPIEGQKKDDVCQMERRVDNIHKLLPTMQNAKNDMMNYMEENVELFSPMTLQRAYETVEYMMGIYKKAQGLRDMSKVVVTSKAFAFLEENVKQELINIWDFAAGITEYTKEKSAVIRATENKTLRECVNSLDADDELQCLGKPWQKYVEFSHKGHMSIFTN